MMGSRKIPPPPAGVMHIHVGSFGDLDPGELTHRLIPAGTPFTMYMNPLLERWSCSAHTLH